MVIDILCNSCARPDLLEQSVYSTKENIVSDIHTFRWVIVEDLVSDKHRRHLGRKWIEDHTDLFDEVVFSKTPAIMDKFLQKILKLCKSPIFIKAEDDTRYLHKINIDPIVDFLIKNNDTISVIFCRKGVTKEHFSEENILDNIKLSKYRLLANSVGVFNTSLTNKLLDSIGWDKVLHENKTLTPAANKLKYKRYMLGHGKPQYIHIGQDKKYRKGKWAQS